MDADSTPLVTALATSDEAQLVVAKSLLDGEGIQYSLKNNAQEDVFAMGMLNPLDGPVEIQVTQDVAIQAAELLRQLEMPPPPDSEFPDAPYTER